MENYDDGEVSFNIAPPSSLSLPLRRRKSSLAAKAVGVQTSSPDEELRTPESFRVSGGEPSIVAVESPVAAAAASSPSALVADPVVAPVEQRTDRRSATIRLGTFNGTNVPLETHLAKLKNCGQYYGWSELDRVCHLKASLEGNAASLLWELPEDCTEQLLLQRLRSRFGDSEQLERYRFELKTRRRRKGESIQALHQDVCRLLALSFPGETGSLSKIVARDAFLDSLGDPEMRIRILEKGASSIEEAFSIAARYESYLAGSADLVQSAEEHRRRVRAVNSQLDGSESNVAWRRNIEQSVAELKDGVSRLLQQQSCSSQTSASTRDATSAVPSTSSGDPRPVNRRFAQNRGTRRCFKCGDPDHIARDCNSAVMPKAGPESTASLRGIQTDSNGSEVYLSASIYQGSKVVNVDVTLDSGSFYSVLPAKYVNQTNVQHTDVRLVAANGSDISVLGQARISFSIGGIKLTAEVLVSNAVDEWLLGFDFLCKNQCVWNFATSTITIRGHDVQLKRRRVLNHVRRVIASDNVVIPSRAAAYVPVKLAFTNLHTRPSNWLIEPRLVTDSLLMARGLFGDAEDSVVRLVNPTDCDVTVRRNYCFGNAEPLNFQCGVCGEVCECVPNEQCETAHMVRALNVDTTDGKSNLPAAKKVDTRDDVAAVTTVLSDDEVIIPMLQSLPDCVTDAQRVEIEELLRRNVNLFSRHEYDVGLTDLVQYKLELKDPLTKPVCEPLRQHPHAYLDLIDSEVDKLLSAKLIVPTNSTWASNVVLVKRKSTPNSPPRIRLTVDFRAVNARLHRLAYPMPSTRLIFDCLQGHSFFTTLDFSNAYLSVKLDPETSHITAFVTRRGMFKWLRLCAGISSGSALFNQLVQSLFSEWLWSEVLTFLDDVTLPSRTIGEGIQLLSKVLDRLQTAGLKLKGSKCKLLQTQVKILGVIVSQNSMQEDPERIAVIKALTFPRTKREMRAFLGYVNFGRSFYKNLSDVTEPLTACLRKGGQVRQTPDTLKAFERLKEIMSSPPVLAMFDPNARHMVDCDSSSYACGACLIQIGPDGKERIVGYMSKTFSDAERRYCTSRQELLAVIKSLQHWRNYLIGRKVVVRSDHKALQYLLGSKSLSAQWNRYLDFLADFDLEIRYKPGKEQKIADFLSRWRPCEVDSERECVQCRPKMNRGATVARRNQIDAAYDTRGCVNHRGGDGRCKCGSTLDASDDRTMGPKLSDKDGSSEQEFMTSDGAGVCNRRSDEPIETGEVSGSSAGPPRDVETVDHAGVGSQRNAERDVDPYMTSAPPCDRINDSEVWSRSLRVQTRSHRDQSTGGQVRPPNASIKLPDVSIGSQWTHDEIVRLQGEDAVLREVRNRLSAGDIPSKEDGAGVGSDPDLICYLRQFDSLVMKDGAVYRKFIDTTGAVQYYQLLLPPSMRVACLELVHAGVLCHARMLSKNEKQLQQHGFWPTWKRDLRVYVMACKRCMQFHSGKPVRQGALRPSGGKLGGPAEQLSVDLTGPHPLSCGFKYCLTAIDCFTKYLFVTPLRDKSAAHVAQALVQIFLKHGFYGVVKSDNGGEFINALQSEIDKLVGVTRLTTIPYTPRQNPVERTHRSLNSMFAKVLERHTDWSAWLPYIAFAYNSTVHKSTGFTPHFLHYGRELASSMNLLLANPSDEYENHGEFATLMIERMNFAHELARQVLHETALQAKRNYDVKVRPQKFEVGDVVLVYYPRKRRNQYPKWQRLFNAQATVLTRVNDITYIVQLEHSRQKRIVHVDKLKLLRRSSAVADGAGHV